MASRRARAKSSDGGIRTEEWQALATRHGDLLFVVDADGLCVDGGESAGTRLVDLFVPDDAPAVEALLTDHAIGPLWMRRLDGMTWLQAVATPREGGGWVVQAREPRPVNAPSAQAGLDSVTGLTSRERALDELAFLLSATPRTGKEIAIVCFDLDHFHAVDERFGWAAGDEVLRVVAGRVGDAVRSGDLVARLEEDTFLVVLRGVHHLRGAIRVANKLRVAVEEEPVPLGAGDVFQTISVGVTILTPGESLDSVLNRAGGAMEMAQHAGGNVVQSSPPI